MLFGNFNNTQISCPGHLQGRKRDTIRGMDNSWQTEPDGLGISAHHVDLWVESTLLDEDRLRAYKKFLSAAELARSGKFKSASRYREYVVTRGLLRQVLARLTGLDITVIEFPDGEHGKPRLDNILDGKTVAFNVSHSHGLALVALTLEGRLGVDLEKIRPEVDWRSLAKQYFSGTEVRALDRYPDDPGLKAFYTCWTRKEAFVKALGAGISYGLDEFDVSIDPDEAYAALTIRRAEEDASRWLVKNIPVPETHVAALALDRSACNFRLWRAPDYRP